MALVPYLNSGDSLTAARMNTLFEEFDRKISLLMGNKSILLLRPYGAGGLSGTASDGLQSFIGKEGFGEGQIFFFLGFATDDTTTTIEPMVMAGIDRPLSHIFHQNPNYVNYNHTPFETAAANTPELFAGTSATAGTISSSGVFTFNTQAGLRYRNGERARATSSNDESKWIEGVCVYAGTSITITADESSGSGDVSSWKISPMARSESRKIVKLLPVEEQYFNSIRRPNLNAISPTYVDSRAMIVPGGHGFSSEGRNSLFRFSLECHTRLVGGVPWSVMEDRYQPHPTSSGVFTSSIFDKYTVAGLCPRMDWQQVELVFDGITDFEFPKKYNRFNFFRIHNFNQNSALGVTFIGSDNGPKHAVTIPAMGSLCVRRSSVDTGYLNGWQHFQRAKKDDPRFYQPNESSYYFNAHRSLHGSNNIVNPRVIESYYYGGLNTTPYGSSIVTDPTLFWDAKTVLCNTTFPVGSPIANVVGGTMAIHHPPAGHGYYGNPDDDNTIVGDLIYNSGVLAKCTYEIPTVSETVIVLPAGKVNYIPLGVGRPIKSTIVIKRGGILIPKQAYSLQFCVGPNVPANIELDLEPGNVNSFILTPGSPLVAGDSVVVTFEKVGMKNSEEVLFRGFATIVADFAAHGITVSENSKGNLTLTGRCDLMTKSTNLLLYCGWPIPGTERMPPLANVWSLSGDYTIPKIPNLDTGLVGGYIDRWRTEGFQFPYTTVFDGYIPGNSTLGYAELAQTHRVTSQVARFNQAWGTQQYEWLSGFIPKVNKIHEIKVGDVKKLNFIGHPTYNLVDQSSPSVSIDDRRVVVGPSGPLLFFKRKENLSDYVLPRRNTSFSSSGESLIFDNLSGQMQIVTQQAIRLTRTEGVDIFDGDFNAFSDGWSTSPRVDMHYGKRRFPLYEGVPKEARLFFNSGYPEASPLKSFSADWKQTPFGGYNLDDKLVGVKSLKKLDGFAFADEFYGFNNNLLNFSKTTTHIIAAHWQNDKAFNHRQPGLSGTFPPTILMADWSQDFSVPNDWYRTNRGAMLNYYIRGSQSITGLFMRSPMLIEHYNKWASYVNSIVSVREYSFQEFYGTFLDGNAATQGSAGVFLIDQYARASLVNGSYTFDNGSYFDKFIAAKNPPLTSLEGSVAYRPRRMKGWGVTSNFEQIQPLATPPDYPGYRVAEPVIPSVPPAPGCQPDGLAFGSLCDAFGRPTALAAALNYPQPNFPVGYGALVAEYNAAVAARNAAIIAHAAWVVARAADQLAWWHNHPPAIHEFGRLIDSPIAWPWGTDQSLREYRYLSITEFTKAAEKTGFKVRWSRMVTKLKLDSFDINWSVIHGTHEERHSEHVGSDLRFAGFRGKNSVDESDDEFNFAIAHAEPPVTLPSWPVHDFFLPTVDYDYESRRWSFASVEPQRTFDINLAVTAKDGLNPLNLEGTAVGSRSWYSYKFTLGANGDKWMKYDGHFLNQNAIVTPYSAPPPPSNPFGPVILPIGTGTSSLTSGLVPRPLNAYPGAFAHRGITGQFPDGRVVDFEVQVVGQTATVHTFKSTNWEYNNNHAADSYAKAVIRATQERPYTVMTSGFKNSGAAVEFRNFVHYNDVVPTTVAIVPPPPPPPPPTSPP